ncbi:MAG: hypothetical protein ABFS32_06135 [Bacteroidota bacterium]
MEKRYWTPTEYDDVIRKIHFGTPDGERFPEFRNPETAPVIKKLVDHQNFLVILSDDQLGINHRSEVADEFFKEYRDLVDAYYLTDRQDKFVYGMELIEILKFGLDLQLYYFEIGNTNIIKSADDPENADIQRTIRSNENAIVGNFNQYLDLVNKETSLNDEELSAFAEGIDVYFPKLFEKYPEANFEKTRNKAELMLKKAKNESVTASLKKILNQLP